MIRASERTILLGAVGASTAAIAWIALAALTGLGKLEELSLPLAPVVAVAGALVAMSRIRLLNWIATSCAAVLLAAFALVALTPFTTCLLPKQLVRRDAPPRAPVDAVVVLSGGITPDSLLRPEALDRLLTGLALMRDSVAPALVLTRARRPQDGVSADADQARLRALVTRPFPVLFVDSVRSTRDEATNAWRLLRTRIALPDSIAIALVTSPLHTRRACATFERVGFSVTCVPAMSRSYSIERASSAPDRLALFRAWLYERAAWALYRTRGWVR
jgi:uncharacterized SAM-binding protein YcdF (DUF218 family)